MTFSSSTTNTLGFPGVTTVRPPNQFRVQRAPTPQDINAEIGDEWEDYSVTPSAFYKLANLYLNVATWLPFAIGTTNLESLSDTAGTVVDPSLPSDSPPSNIQLTNLDGSMNIVADAGNNRIIFSSGIGNFPVTPYVVGPVNQAGYQTIQSALDAANAAGSGIVVIQPGTYTEDLTLYNGINVMGLNFADAGGGVLIIGTHTPPATGGFVFRNVALQSPTAIFQSNAAGTAHLVIADAIIDITNGYTFDLPNWTGKLESFDVNAAVGTADGYINNTGGAEVDIFECSVGSGTANPMTVSGFSLGAGANIYCSINFTGGTAQFDYSDFNGTVTFSGASTGEFSSVRINAGANAAVVMSSTSNWTITNSTLISSNNPCIDGAGAGTLTLGSITFVNNAAIQGTVNLSYATATEVGDLYAQNISFDRGTTFLDTDGQLWIGSTGNNPQVGNLTSTNGSITITNGPGTINLEANNAGQNWVVVTTNQTAADSTGYFTNAAGNVNILLPVSSVIGDTFEVCQMSSTGSWTITQSAGQSITLLNLTSTVGAGGSITSTSQGAWIILTCDVANLHWYASMKEGVATIV
jgi:hypothetical protein